MSVIGNSCTVPSEKSPGCGCGINRKPGGKVAGAAATTALAAAACTACCILPFTLPAVILASAGGTIAILDHAHTWLTRLAMLAVVGGWLWIGWQVKKTKRRPTGLTVAAMVFATILTAVAVSWPVIEPVAFNALGIFKKRTIPHDG